MKRLIPVYILLSVVLFTEYSTAQNLVPNPSFETYSTCPFLAGSVSLATPWVQPTPSGTSDYFNACSSFPFSAVPSNTFGVQSPATGDAYVGFFSIDGFSDNGYREYAQTALTTPLTVGTQYCVQFYVTLSDNAVNATDGLGALLSVGAATTSGSGIIPGTPQAVSNGVIDEKSQWVEVSSNFTATQAYTHITVGNFNPLGTSTIVTSTATPDTATGSIPLPMPGAYYWLDDVYVGEGTCPNLCGISASSTVTEATCGQTNGSASLSVTGGSGNFSYAWSTGDTTSSLMNAGAGVYSVTISDTLGCDVVQFVQIEEDTDLEISVSGTNAGCSGSGSAEVAISGGASPYQILWETSATTDNITDLSAGIYTVVVTDSIGCTQTDSVEIISASTFSLTPSITHAGCTGGTSSGAIGVAPSGGTPPFTYSWSTGSQNASITGLSAGNYTITVTDGGGCVVQQTYTINNANSTLSVTASVNGNTLTATSAGATTYQWYYNGSPIQGSTQATHTVTQSGSYWVVVTDANGCSATSNTIETSVLESIEELAGISSLNLYPNPTSQGSFYVELDAEISQQLNITINNTLGQLLSTETLQVNSGKMRLEFSTVDMPSGTYILEINNNKSSIYKKLVVKN